LKGHTSDHPQLGLLLRLLHHHWTQAIEAALEDAGFGDIRPPHANVFTFARPDGIQVSELTKLANVRKQTMAQAVEELEQLGYVERRPDPNDRRARLVYLTARGEAVRPIAMAAGRRVHAHWAELTSPKQLDSLERSLRSLLQALQNEPLMPSDPPPGQPI
jgi:DNA-binding MarR family transcriptional regulator